MRTNYLAWSASAIILLISPATEAQHHKSHNIDWKQLRCLESRSEDLDLQKQEADATPNPLHLFIKRINQTLMVNEEDFLMTYKIVDQHRQGLGASRDTDPMPLGIDEIMIDSSGTKALMLEAWLGGKFAHSFSGSATLFLCERQ